MLLNCETCGKSFNRKPSEIGKHIYCSRDCRNIAVSKDKTLNGRYSGGKYVKCCICNKEIYKTPCHLKIGSDHPTCSITCYSKWRSANLIGDKAYNFKNKLINHECKVCGTKFSSYFKQSKFCSRSCKNKGQSKPNKVKCMSCGKTFLRPDSYFKYHKLRGRSLYFCSKKCSGKFYSGGNSPLWIADRSKLKNKKKSFRSSLAMKEWRKSVFIRDNYICRICRDKSIKGHKVVLNAHHIIPIKQDEGLAFDINNGITLCEKCHKKTYRKECELSKLFYEIIHRLVHDGKIELSGITG